MSTAPRIPRRRAPVIPLFDRPAWYESTAHRVVGLVLLSTFGGIAVHALLAWWALR